MTLPDEKEILFSQSRGCVVPTPKGVGGFDLNRPKILGG